MTALGYFGPYSVANRCAASRACARVSACFVQGTTACVGYAMPEAELRDDLDRKFRSVAMRSAAAFGEPWLSFFTERPSGQSRYVVVEN